MKQVYKYSMGADPEMFVRSTKAFDTDKVIPVCGLVGGSKDAPVPFNATNYPGYFYQEDGTAFEVNIPAVYKPEGFWRAHRTVLGLTNTLLNSKGLTYYDKPTARFSKEELQHPNAQRIGCDPDMCAYDADGKLDPTARKPFKTEDFGTERFAGGHIHFGFDKELIPDHVFVAMIEALLYFPMLPLDNQGSRRRFYGKAGLYRSKDYGIEYRTPSNFWFMNGSYVEWIGVYGFHILQLLHTQTEELAEVFKSLPLDEIKTLIDLGVNTAEDRGKHAKITHRMSEANPLISWVGAWVRK